MRVDHVTTLDMADGIAVVCTDSPPVNALSAAVRAGLATALAGAITDPTVGAIVVMCAGRTFYAGADITEFGKPIAPPRLQDVQQIIEFSPKPVVAAIHGTAFGGGLELALAAHFRVAVPSAKCGLPEVKLGIIPGAGGTQRLPRVVGVPMALDMITSGAPIGAKVAREHGLVDELAAEGQLREHAVAFARRIVAEKRPPRRVRDLEGKIAPARDTPEIFSAFRAANARKFRGLEAPEAAIGSIEAAVTTPFDQGLALEREHFIRLVGGAQSAALRHVFFAERQAARIADLPPDTRERPIGRVGIVGAGAMGGGIAMNFLEIGVPVRIVDSTQPALDRGLGSICKNYDVSAKKGKLNAADVAGRMRLLSPTLELADLGDCDLIIEAVFEQMDIKKAVFEKLDDIAKPGAILASNTSYLDIDEIASATRRPEDVVGLHFFSPANVMRLLEVVRGRRTAKPVLATALKLAKSIGKVGVLVGNCHGFVGNRMLTVRQEEADRVVLEGTSPWDVDRVFTDFGFPMGPFEMRDLAGMDIGWDAARSSSSTIREILCEMGRRGQKTGAGYYDYDENRKGVPSAKVEEVIRAFATRKGVAPRSIGSQEIIERCLYAMVNEGARILAGGIAARASDIDIVWVTGYGWPAYRGGPMYWAGTEGVPKIRDRLCRLAASYGPRFAPAPLLERLAAEGKDFSHA